MDARGRTRWWVLPFPEHAGLRHWFAHPKRVYRVEGALHEVDFAAAGFEWIDASDHEASTLAGVRRSRSAEPVRAVCNCTAVARHHDAVEVPQPGCRREVANSDAREYGGSAMGNLGGASSHPVPAHGRLQSLTLALPPLATVMLKREGGT